MSVLVNRVRPDFYLDSVALMRLSRRLAGADGVADAALMIGTPANKAILAEAGLLDAAGEAAGANDLILAIRAESESAAESALGAAEKGLEAPPGAAATAYRPKTLAGAHEALPEADLALISVPGAFAAGEARKALAAGLDVMIFSDNVPLQAERALKEEAARRGLLVMGPDCGTALIGGVPLGFANAIPRGDIGIVAASGTGLQEVSCLIAHGGGGVSHGIGVGGRDLEAAIGGLATLAALDRLDADPATRRIVVLSKPPAAAVAVRVLARAGESGKSVTLCFLGHRPSEVPANVHAVATLAEAAADALGHAPVALSPSAERAATAAAGARPPERKWIHGLFAGGSLCAEAQVVLMRAGLAVRSNAPVPPAEPLIDAPGHRLLDLGADAYTLGRPHPMIEPEVRAGPLTEALADATVAVVLLDVVLGTGGHADPAGAVAAALAAHEGARPAVVASLCGVEGDPQGYAGQRAALEAAGVIVAPCAALAAELCLRIVAAGEPA